MKSYFLYTSLIIQCNQGTNSGFFALHQTERFFFLIFHNLNRNPIYCFTSSQRFNIRLVLSKDCVGKKTFYIFLQVSNVDTFFLNLHSRCIRQTIALDQSDCRRKQVIFWSCTLTAHVRGARRRWLVPICNWNWMNNVNFVVLFLLHPWLDWLWIEAVPTLTLGLPVLGVVEAWWWSFPLDKVVVSIFYKRKNVCKLGIVRWHHSQLILQGWLWNLKQPSQDSQLIFYLRAILKIEVLTNIY